MPAPVSPNTLVARQASEDQPPLSIKGDPAKLRWAVSNPPADLAVSFAGKTILVMGANTGLGFAAALNYAAKDTSRLILGVRSAAKGEAAARDISAGTGMPAAQLGSALLAVLVLPLLQAAADGGGQPHLTFVNSIAHADVEREWLAGSGGSLLQAANDEATFDARKHYGMVKLLAEQSRGARRPKRRRTDLGREFPLVQKAVTTVFQAFFARSAEEGARTLVGATALDPESHGLLWHHDLLYLVGDLAQDGAFMDKTWADIRQVLLEAQPDLKSRLEN
ncbi:hypothetical protein RB594_006222 [Gaeumannomyces avenae]